MADTNSRLFLVRHGDTDWTDTQRHTGRTDIPLNARGEERAIELSNVLNRFQFSQIWTSPLQRASKTCQLTGFSSSAIENRDLVEWDYGELEGLTTLQIKEKHPDWELFSNGCPKGESPEQVAARADRFIEQALKTPGDTLAFSSGHIIRMIAARWLNLSPSAARIFFCRPASVGVLTYEHQSSREPIVGLWNYIVTPNGWEPLISDYTDSVMRA